MVYKMFMDLDFVSIFDLSLKKKSRYDFVDFFEEGRMFFFDKVGGGMYKKNFMKRYCK